ncbi:MAG: single-stranded-DNA-specific exonuclease RecJ [Thermodesulfobacteriota bacterium]|nr:single-stranded-DNA-specific exonuclease RecJ [Thermodesulfobacteriota bacterium]
MKKTWCVHSPDHDKISRLVTELSCHRPVAAVLVNRGLSAPKEAASFLKPSFADMRSPFLMKDMDRAVSRLLLALERREKVLVFGDYDADGMSGTALLFNFFAYLGMEVAYYIPDRLTEGYGLSPQSVERQAAGRNIGLIVTVDCGISSHEAVQEANRYGIDVIVTDHHEPSEQPLEAFAILNPKQPDCASGLTCLAGVGVAFNLALALRKRLRDQGFWDLRPEPNLKASCDLVAIGTVADMVPILQENRIYVKAGLEVLATSTRPGIKALLGVCNVTNGRIDTWDVAFKLAPRINAAGRLRHGSMGCELLTTSSRRIAQTIADELDHENTRRRDIEREILSDIVCGLEAPPQTLGRSLVLHNPTWHEGVIGIVASRLVHQYMRPVVLIAVTDGMGKGSARSPKGFNLFEALVGCAQHLEKFGGHQSAAGLTLKAENIPAFSRAFDRQVREMASPEDFIPRLDIDTEISPAEITPELADELEALAPFGTANPEPLFVLSDMEVRSARVVGNCHTQMQLVPAGDSASRPFQAIAFNRAAEEPIPDEFHHIACHIRWNRWKDRKSLQLIIRDFVPH